MSRVSMGVFLIVAVGAVAVSAQQTSSDNACANCVADTASADERFTFRGSWGDKSSSRALRWGPHAYGYTWETCTAACQGYRYMALQDADTTTGQGYCSCCNTWTEVNKYGSESCGEYQNETCNCGPIGGKWCNFVIELNYNPSSPYKYFARGYYLDRVDATATTGTRALTSGPQVGGYFEELCAATCKAIDAKYFAILLNSSVSSSENRCSCSSDWNEVAQYGTCVGNSTGCNQVFELGSGDSSSSSSSSSLGGEGLQFQMMSSASSGVAGILSFASLLFGCGMVSSILLFV